MLTSVIEKSKNFFGIHGHKALATMSGVERVLLCSLLYLWFANWATKAWEHIYRAQNFDGHWTASLADWRVAALILILIRVATLCERNEQRDRSINREWNKILAKSGILCGLRISHFVVSTTILTFFICFFAINSLEQGGHAIACMLSDAKQYELAERVYRLAPDLSQNKSSGRYSSMSVWHSSFTHEDPDTISLKNAAVATVYGPKSREMAKRFFYLGLTFENQGSRAAELEAIYWHHKAYSVYKHNHAITKCIDALTQIAIFQDGYDTPEFKRLMRQAAQLTPQLDEEPFASTVSILPYFARRNGDNQQALLFEQAFEKHKNIPQETDPSVRIIVVLFALFSSRLGSSLAKALTLRAMAICAQKNYQNASNLDARCKSLDQLVTLNLIRQNVQLADEQSALLLASAEGRPSTCLVREESLASVHKCIGIELFRIFFAIILWTFI